MVNFSLTDCEKLELCRLNLKQIVSFVKSIELVFSFQESSDIFVVERPDFNFGRLLLSFADRIFSNDADRCLGQDGIFYCQNFCEASHADETVTGFISSLVINYLTSYGSGNVMKNPCHNSTQKLLEARYDTFVDVIMHSEIKSSLNTEESRIKFKEKYLKGLMVALNMSTLKLKPMFPTTRVEMIYFCDFGMEQGDINNTSENNCSLFQPFLTPKGFCFTFNSLSMKEIFQSTDNLNHWDSVLGFKNKSILVQPAGPSPSNGFKFILNSFERFGLEPSRKNFILSIINEYNPFDIINRNYLIEPGYSYTFRVLANQVISSSNLNKMEPNNRKCLLANESELLNLTKMYSKSSCEYECLIKHALMECHCIPWNMPELHLENLTYCNYQQTDCFATIKNTFLAANCNCPSDCEETSFSIIQSKQIIELEHDFCTNQWFNINFPNSIFCKLCQAIIKEQRIRFVHEHIVNDGPDPNDLGQVLPEICN